MAAIGPEIDDGFLDIPVSSSELPLRLKAKSDNPLRFEVQCFTTGIEYIPYYQIGDEDFTCYPFLSKM